MNDHNFSWGHININVADLDRAIVFYEKLGFEAYMAAIPYLGLDIDDPAKPINGDAALALGLDPVVCGRACIMQLSGGGFPKIDLTELREHSGGGGPLGNEDRGLVRFCLLSRDVVGAYTSLASQGVEFLSAPQLGEDGMVTMALCKDPDGTLIELLEIHRDKWRAR